jgi:3-phosphoglycerate kinase
MQIKSVRDAEVAGKRVLMRVDFNVPIKEGRVLDDTRLKVALPTLEFLQKNGASKIILLTHVGRPQGKVDESLCIAPIEERLQEIFAESNLGEKMVWPRSGDPRTFSRRDSTEIELRENLRFDPREESNGEEFAKELASAGDVFVNEAFPISHRRSASIVGIPKFLPSFMGLRFEEEIEQLTPALTPPPHSVAIIGGAKFETKIPLIEKLLKSYKKVMLGGALANDLLKSRGMPVGSSLVSATPVPVVIAENERLLAPKDVALLDEKTDMGRTTYTSDVRMGEKILDIGPQTIEHWSKEVASAEFVLWSGPLGMYEGGFVEGTDGIAHALAHSGASAVVGGGDTIAAIQRFDLNSELSRSNLEKSGKIFISTGGGAMLEFLTSGTLPGIVALAK